MKKIFKYFAYSLGGLIGLLVIVIAIVAATFNPNDYKQQIIDLVQAKKSRTLSLEGDIKLAFWPKIGANLGKVSLSEHNNSAEFAAVNSVKVSLALLPLLKKQLIVDTVYVDGARANIVKYKDGSTNFDDLLSKDDEESLDIKFDIDGINVTNSAASYSDEATGAKYNISKLNLKSGHVALAQPVDLATDFFITANQPLVSATAKLKGIFLVDPETKHFSVKGLDAEIKGDLLSGKDVSINASGDVDAKPASKEFLIDGLKLDATGLFDGAKLTINLTAPALIAQHDVVTSKKTSVSLVQEKAGDVFKANLVLADLKGSPKALQSSGITGDISAVQAKRSINGKFSSPFSGNLESLIFDIPQLAGNLDIKDPALPNGGMQGRYNLSLHTDINNALANSKFSLSIDETKLNGDVAVAGFKQPSIKFNLNADKLNLNKLLKKSVQPATKASEKPADKPADLSLLKTLRLDGKLNVGSILYDQYRISGLNVSIKADGEKLTLSGMNVKVDDSQIKGNVAISQFAKPLYRFDLDIDRLDVDRYVSASATPADKNSRDKPMDLSALKALNADGSLRIGKLKYGKTKASNIRIDLKAADGLATIAPFSANLYQGSMSGMLKVDARSTPSITFKQEMKSIAIGPLLIDAINNNMLDGKGSLNVDVTTSGNTVGALKKNLAGKAAVNLADGAVKGIDIAGTLREVKSKINIFKDKNSLGADQTKKTDFSELTASFDIKNGVAHNEDLAIKAPILRLAKGDSRGDIDIGNETINYLAKPTVVKSLKGQGGAELDALAGFSIPVKITGTFSNPKYGMDFAAIGAAVAKSNLLDKVAGDKGAAIKGLLGDGDKADALKGLLGKKTPEPATAPAKTETAPQQEAAPKPAEVPAKEKAAQKLKKLLNF